MGSHVTHYQGNRYYQVLCGHTQFMYATNLVYEVTCKRCLNILKPPPAPENEKVDMSRLTFVEEFENHSTYRDENGETIYLANDTHARLKPLAEIRISEEWDHYSSWGNGARLRSSERKRMFLEQHLPSLTYEKEVARQFKFCGHCARLHNNTTDGVIDTQGILACNRCKRDYLHQCGHCNGWAQRVWHVEGGTQGCEPCLVQQRLTHCRQCNVYFDRRTSTVSHKHDGTDCCTAPEEMMVFSMRNDGLDPVISDTINRVTLPAGVLTDVGRSEIANYLMGLRYSTTKVEEQRAWINLGSNLDKIGENWQTKEGNYPKRVSRYAYKNFGLKVSADVMSEIGNIGARHTVAVDFDIEFSRLFDQTAAEWGHGGSCWWQSYWHCRCALKSNGAVGLRSIAMNPDGSRGEVVGRCWIFPLKKVTDKPRNGDPVNGWLVPTFNTETPDAFLVFNGYNNLSGYAAPRLLAHMQGMTYRKVDMQFTLLPKKAYINSGSGYIVAPEDIATHFTDGSIAVTVEQHASLFKQETGSDPTPAKTTRKKGKKKDKQAAVADLADLANQIDLAAGRMADMRVNANVARPAFRFIEAPVEWNEEPNQARPVEVEW